MKDRILIYDEIRGNNFSVLVDDISIAWITPKENEVYISFGVKDNGWTQLYVEHYKDLQEAEMRIKELEEYFGDVVGVWRPVKKENDNDK